MGSTNMMLSLGDGTAQLCHIGDVHDKYSGRMIAGVCELESLMEDVSSDVEIMRCVRVVGTSGALVGDGVRGGEDVVDGREIDGDLTNGEMFFKNREGVVRRQGELMVNLAEMDLDGHGGVVDNGGVIVRVT
jgi:hypothetical protein